MDMKKLLGLTLACALLLTGCGARGGDKGEKLGDNTIRPLELTGEEAALLKLVGGSDAEYGLFECAAGEGVSDCTVEVLSWEDGAWQTVAEGGVSISAAGTRRLGVVLSGDHRKCPGRWHPIQLRPPAGRDGPRPGDRPGLGLAGGRSGHDHRGAHAALSGDL